MKLIVMIPAHNEEGTIGNVIRDIPRKIDGIDEVQVIVMEDGSTDRTAEIARDAGADYVISRKERLGLAKAFEEGLNLAVEIGADIIVNIDADNQYNPNEIPKLIRPILDGEADIVLGNRQIDKLDHMPLSKKMGNKIATFVTSKLSGIHISDAQTGFRAFSRRAAMMLSISSEYTYTQETIIQSAYKKLKIVEVPVEFRKRDGKSRLISSVWNYGKKAGATVLLTYLNYKPLKAFFIMGSLLVLAGLLLSLKIIIQFFITGSVSPYYPTLVLISILVVIGFQIMIMGLLASMIKHNREILEHVLFRIREMKK
ncbi:MAG: glycosyltransferase family 2 protein [Methanomassiliicoccales archaeon]|nr:glycosyltransferase family 2 protein [Methanomassiliicoccales archaeon]